MPIQLPIFVSDAKVGLSRYQSVFAALGLFHN